METLIWVLELVYHEEVFGNLGTPLLFLVYLQDLCIEIWLFVLILVNGGYKASALSVGPLVAFGYIYVWLREKYI